MQQLGFAFQRLDILKADIFVVKCNQHTKCRMRQLGSDP